MSGGPGKGQGRGPKRPLLQKEKAPIALPGQGRKPAWRDGSLRRQRYEPMGLAGVRELPAVVPPQEPEGSAGAAELRGPVGGQSAGLTPEQLRAWEEMSQEQLGLRLLEARPSDRRRAMVDISGLTAAATMTEQELAQRGYTLRPEDFQAGRAFQNSELWDRLAPRSGLSRWARDGYSEYLSPAQLEVARTIRRANSPSCAEHTDFVSDSVGEWVRWGAVRP